MADEAPNYDISTKWRTFVSYLLCVCVCVQIEVQRGVVEQSVIGRWKHGFSLSTPFFVKCVLLARLSLMHVC